MKQYRTSLCAAALVALLAAAPAAAQVVEGSVEAGLAQLGINVDADTLSAEQMLEIEAVLNTEDDDTVKTERIERIIAE